MLDALTALLINDMEAQFRRRTDAILALVAFAGEEESVRTKVPDVREPSPPMEFRRALSPKKQMDEICGLVLVSVIGRSKVRRCFLCVTKACSLGQAHGRFNDLCHILYDEHTLARHFTSVHLDTVAEDQWLECPHYLVPLYDKNHLRLHIDDIHGINTARKRQMRYVNGKETAR